MTLQELITDIRTRLLDDTGGAGTDWTLEASKRLLRWSNQELTELINEAMRETARRVKSITDNQTINVIAGTGSYSLDPLAFKIRRAKLASVTTAGTLDEVSWKDLDAMRPDWETRTGTPTHYMLDWEKGRVTLYPIPIVDDILNLNVYRYPESDMTLDNWDSDEPELEEEYQRNALYWAAKLAYEKDEPNSIDDERVIKMEATYISHFGVPESAYAIERKKRTKRSISYGGIKTGKRYHRGKYNAPGYW